MNKQQIAAEIAALESVVEKAQARIKELCGLVEWKRPYTTDAFYVDAWGKVEQVVGDHKSFALALHDFGNHWLSEKSAEHSRLRLESMNPVMPEPELRSMAFRVWFDHHGWQVGCITYGRNWSEQYVAGRILPTEESAREWIEKNGEAWKTVPEEFKS